MVMDMPNTTNVSCKWFEMGIVFLKLYIVLNLMFHHVKYIPLISYMHFCVLMYIISV